MFNIWTTQLNSQPGTEPEYMRWPSRKFVDWLTYIEWWGLPNMSGFGYIIVDDVTPAAKKNPRYTEDGKGFCFKGLDYEKGALMTAPWVGFVAAVAVIASIY